MKNKDIQNSMRFGKDLYRDAFPSKKAQPVKYASWLDSHVVVLGPDEDTEKAIKNKLREQLKE